MPQSAQMQEIDPKLFSTFHDATQRYKLHEQTKDLTNAQLADRLGLEHCHGDHHGFPNCCFYFDGRLVAIRTKADEVSVFHVWQLFQARMREIADQVG